MMLTHLCAFVVRFVRSAPGRSGFVPRVLALLVFCLIPLVRPAMAQAAHAKPRQRVRRQLVRRQLVWIDTDIGDDLDDAFAVALLLRSPEVRVVGISTTFGDTELRARLLDHFLAASRTTGIPGTAGIPVYAGLPTATTNLFTQRAYAEQSPPRVHPDAVSALLAAVQQYGDRLTVLAIGPLFNVAAAIDRNPETMRHLGRIVLMGGSVRHGYLGADGRPTPPAPEWNIAQDPRGAQTVFGSGIRIDLFPLDSTQIALRQADRNRIFSAATPFALPLRTLYGEWQPHAWNHSASPVLFDAVAAAFLLDPQVCPVHPMRLTVTAEGMTQVVTGSAAAPAVAASPGMASPVVAGPGSVQVCLRSDARGFLGLLESRLGAAQAGKQ